MSAGSRGSRGAPARRRVYLPLALAGLDRLAADREVAPGPLRAHAVTAALARAMPGAEEEDREYVALCDAVEAAGGLRGSPGDRRVVAAADVAADVVAEVVEGPGEVVGEVAEGAGARSRVTLSAAVPLRRVVSFHVDEVGGDDDADLLWYDVTELDGLRRLARGAGYS